MITEQEFDRIDIRIGQVVSVMMNRRTRVPAYAITLDFGPEIGLKKTSSQITDLYTAEELIGRQLLCCVNLEPKYIGKVKSEVRIIAAETSSGYVLLQPDWPVDNGSPVT